ncbi:MAG: Hemerythrin HHE cation binding domain protein [Candidatus Hydrogenedentes bacterium ADurb.Bin179]|nr:MAG: Hemerythrin HHE cation binding domain protein [Candidatus Hydrogenedentes bacterium ADurb.Bin179]
MKKCLIELGQEHGGIQLMLRILEAIAKQIEAGQPAPEADLDAIAEFLSVFADRCHHGKEEDFLFPALQNLDIPAGKETIKVLLSEHQKGRGLIGAMKGAIAGLEKGEENAKKRIVEAGRGYIDLLTRHIEKENQFFRAADSQLSEAEDGRLVEAFEKLERERIGPGRHEEFHALLDWLSRTYLK